MVIPIHQLGFLYGLNELIIVEGLEQDLLLNKHDIHLCLSL